MYERIVILRKDDACFNCDNANKEIKWDFLGAAQPEAVPEPQAVVEKPAAPAAVLAKPEKKKKEKAASADKPEKKPQAEEEAVHVGR